jgi:hypothetical protein
VVAVAHTVKHDSKVTISFKRGHQDVSDEFSGKVISQKDRCERRREVKVKLRLDGPDSTVGTDFTNRDGEWEVEAPDNPAGTYYAKAMRKVLKRDDDHLHACKRVFSNDLKVKDKPA